MRYFLFLSALVGVISALPFQSVVDVGLTKHGGDDMTILCNSDTDDRSGFCASEKVCADGKGRSIGSCGKVSVYYLII